MPEESYGVSYGNKLLSFYREDGTLSYTAEGAFRTTLKHAAEIAQVEQLAGLGTLDVLKTYKKSARVVVFKNGKCEPVELREKAFHG